MVKYGFIILLIILSSLLIWGWIDQRGKDRAYQTEIERFETETEKLRKDNGELRKEITGLSEELQNSDGIIKRIESRSESLEKRYRFVMEILGANEDIHSELGENTEAFGRENQEFEKDIRELEKILAEFLVD